ncbi:MAG: hypothetical protein ABSD08_20775, partial [Xanthobacteraceae bacterium]
MKVELKQVGRGADQGQAPIAASHAIGIRREPIKRRKIEAFDHAHALAIKLDIVRKCDADDATSRYDFRARLQQHACGMFCH